MPDKDITEQFKAIVDTAIDEAVNALVEKTQFRQLIHKRAELLLERDGELNSILRKRLIAALVNEGA